MNQTQFQKAAGISAGLAARWFPHITAAMKSLASLPLSTKQCSLLNAAMKALGLTG